MPTSKAAPKSSSSTPSAPKPAAKKKSQAPSNEAIQAKAWEIYQQRLIEGRPGNDESDWHEAIKALGA